MRGPLRHPTAGRCGLPTCGPVGAENRVTLCDLRVFIDQSAEPIVSYDLDQVVWCRRRRILGVGWSLLECPVLPVPVVVIDVLGQDGAQVSLSADYELVGGLSPAAGD